MAKQRLIPKGGNDIVMTPVPLAKAIIAHFNPNKLGNTILDPCKGAGAFYNNFDHRYVDADWCELQYDKDFLSLDTKLSHPHYDWILSNPPWSKFRKFLNRSMDLADNIVFLATINHFFLTARLRDMAEKGFGIKEILHVPTPKKITGWPQSGFALGAVHLQKNWIGDIKRSII